MKRMLRKLESSFEETNFGFAVFLFVTITPMLGVMLHCGYNIYSGNALETYDLIIMGHPVLTSLGVSYLEVLIADVVTFFALIIGLAFRYYYYRDERDFMKKYNIKGKTGFTSDFNSKSSSGNSYDSSYDE